MDTSTCRHACTHTHVTSYTTITSHSWGAQVVSHRLCRCHLRTLLILRGPLMSALIPKCLSCPCCYSSCYCCHDALHKHIYSLFQNLLLFWVASPHWWEQKKKKKPLRFICQKYRNSHPQCVTRNHLSSFSSPVGCWPFHCHCPKIILDLYLGLDSIFLACVNPATLNDTTLFTKVFLNHGRQDEVSLSILIF